VRAREYVFLVLIGIGLVVVFGAAADYLLR
jgi:hypothetical protein